MKRVKLFEQYITEKEEYKVAGRPVTLNKGEKENGTDWTVTFLSDSSISRKGEEVPLSDVLALIKPFPKGIKESVLNEYTNYNFKPAEPSSKDKRAAEKWLKKYMLRTAKTTDAAEKRIQGFAGGVMFTHVQYHVVKPNGNKPDRPTFRLHQSQEWLNDANLQGREEVNATLLTIYQLKDGEEWNSSQGDAYEKVGQIYVDTKAFLDEIGIVFGIIKRSM